MGLRSSLRTPFFGGMGVSNLVPDLWDCAINGRTFRFDTKFFGQAQFTRSSIPLLKPQQAQGSINESSLNPADGIRAAIESWHHGAGQTSLDRDTSDPYRFRSSKGVDPWTKWKLSLLPDTDQKRTSANTNLALVPAGARLYLADGQTLAYTTDVTLGTPTFTAVTGTPAVAINGIASDGFTVWTAHGASGIYDTNTGAGASASRTTGTVGGVLGYVKGRLMAADANAIYNIVLLTGAAAARPTALYTHPNTDFVWVGFAEGLQNIYAAGYSGDKSLIYKVPIKQDGSGLDAASVAGELPDGEIVRSLGSYLGLVLVGTDKGVWVASQDSDGNLSLNKVVDLDAACYCFEGQGDFVWFGWTNYDSTSAGLGRMDLRSDTKGASVLTPAYASDLMATAQGAVLSIATFQDIRVFAISGSGVWAEDIVKVTSGSLDTGLITQGMTDSKVALSIKITHEPLNGTIDLLMSADGGVFGSRGSSIDPLSTSASLSASTTTGETFELRFTLNRPSTTTLGPVLTRATLESNLAPGRGEYFNVALLFHDLIKLTDEGQEVHFDCAANYARLVDWEISGLPLSYQDALGSATVLLEDHDFVIEGWTEKRDAYTGTFLAKFRKPRSTI